MTATPARFLALKIWGARLGLLALVLLGFGCGPGLIFQSYACGIAGAVLGVALFARRIFHISGEDIAF